MATDFYQRGWYESRCLEECDKILQKWPEDKSIQLTFVIQTKVYALAALNRWQEAYKINELFYQQHKDDKTIYHTTDNYHNIPYNYLLLLNMLGTKAGLLHARK